MFITIFIITVLFLVYNIKVIKLMKIKESKFSLVELPYRVGNREKA